VTPGGAAELARGMPCREWPLRRMIDWSSYLVSRVMVVNYIDLHYYERYINLVYSWLVPWKTAAQISQTCAA
jgi:hypothetical protein